MRKPFAAVVAVALLVTGPVAAAPPDWPKVDQIFGRSGTRIGEVHRYGLPRSDLQVTLDGVEIRPALALGTWVAFQPHGEEMMVMGDLVLTGEEVNKVMKRLIDGGIAITAVHNHLLRSVPTTLYMHIAGRGDAVQLATVIAEALALSATPLGAPAAAPPPAGRELNIETDRIDAVLGRKGEANGGVYQVSIPRAETIEDEGMAVPPAMGTAIAINFQPTGGGKAAITGDFVLLASEVQPVLAALRGAGIEVTALHSHMLNEEPRLFFMHFWANDDAGKLAEGLRAALDQVNLRRD